jgi:site-specific recombinase XerD
MLITYRRHNPKKCRLKSRSEYRCQCPIWVTGTRANGERVREALKIRDWNRAQELVRKWDVEGTRPTEAHRVTLDEWRNTFLQDAAARHLTEATTKLYRLLFKQLAAFAKSMRIHFINELDLEILTEFRSGWTNGPLSAQKKLERLRGIFKFALARKWITENFALALTSPKVKQKPTMPFTSDEMAAILKAAEGKGRERILAFILTMRFSGLRISDVTSLKTESLQGNRLFLYQAKTGEPVSILLPDSVAENLRSLPLANPQYFFWNGQSKLNTKIGFWRNRISKVFKRAKITGGHTHRFRDTFAVSLLEAGVSLENVSTLLGHQSLRVTQKHYAPWVRTRQDALDRAVQAALASVGRRKLPPRPRKRGRRQSRRRVLHTRPAHPTDLSR